ncbi:hypothetical protein DL96DRAFT_1677554 [Flagelloscypha sp. PMI_526]|nr:hypothetical protein DL96DRAFT_1677554 [Flagelloscypha sp. PMI_526]
MTWWMNVRNREERVGIRTEIYSECHQRPRTFFGKVDALRPWRPTAGIHGKPVAPLSSSDKGKGASIDHTANIQGMQNLTGFGADLHDTLAPYMPLLTYSSSATQTSASVLLLVFLLDGSTSHIPRTLDHFVSTVIMKLVRLLDDDRLDDRVWASEVREVELFENERLGSSDGEKKE